MLPSGANNGARNEGQVPFWSSHVPRHCLERTEWLEVVVLTVQHAQLVAREANGAHVLRLRSRSCGDVHAAALRRAL
jgi:hypothetical protein